MAGTIVKTEVRSICTGAHGGINDRREVVIDWIGDAANGSVPALVLDTEDLCVEGWYFYSAKTIPGAGGLAPTDQYDITIKDSDGLDIAGGLLENRGVVAAEIVNIGNAAQGFTPVQGELTVQVSNSIVHLAEGSLILAFTME
jgi:hypothetical protein